MKRADYVKLFALRHSITEEQAEGRVPPGEVYGNINPTPGSVVPLSTENKKETVSAPGTSMDCTRCFRKHLQCILSFGEEVMNGHGASRNDKRQLDHRPDVAANWSGAENHVRNINPTIAEQLRAIRHDLDARKWQVEQRDLDFIRKLWLRSIDDSIALPDSAAPVAAKTLGAPMSAPVPVAPANPCGCGGKKAVATAPAIPVVMKDLALGEPRGTAL